MDVEKIEHGGKLFAIILRNGFEMDGVNFLTPKDNPLQLGILKHRKGHEIRPHIHKENERIIKDTQEILYIVRGNVRVNFYDDEKFESTILNEGDVILLLQGGHGFEILEDSKIIEIKQGPYMSPDVDKKPLR
ncbi:MAG: hypothetical protein V1921_07835 [Candidatus Altiarchaeota archaeon]